MKTPVRFLLMLAIGLCASGAARVEAQTFAVNARLTMQYQDYSSLKNGVYTDKVKTERLTSTSLLSLLADAYQTEYPSGFPFGAQLVLVNYDHFQVQSAAGDILVTNASPYLTYTDTYVTDDYLYQGKENTNNGSQNYTYYFRSTIEFASPSTNGTSFKFSGNTMERYSQSTANSFGKRSYSDSFMLTGDGSGHTDGGYFLLSGRITTTTMKWVQ